MEERWQKQVHFSIDTLNVIISAIKQSENGNDIIFRCVETSGSACKTTLDLQFAGRKWTGNFRPCEIKTLRMNQKMSEIKGG
jgi:alpha-mannosidase